MLPDEFIFTSNNVLGVGFYTVEVSDRNIACWSNYMIIRRFLS